MHTTTKPEVLQNFEMKRTVNLIVVSVFNEIVLSQKVKKRSEAIRQRKELVSHYKTSLSLRPLASL